MRAQIAAGAKLRPAHRVCVSLLVVGSTHETPPNHILHRTRLQAKWQVLSQRTFFAFENLLDRTGVGGWERAILYHLHDAFGVGVRAEGQVRYLSSPQPQAQTELHLSVSLEPAYTMFASQHLHRFLQRFTRTISKIKKQFEVNQQTQTNYVIFVFFIIYRRIVFVWHFHFSKCEK